MNTIHDRFSTKIKLLRKSARQVKRKLVLGIKQPVQVFNEIYRNNSWGDKESISGPGSRLDRTEKIRTALPSLVMRYDCDSILDIPCGDYNWMKSMDLACDYIGADIVSGLVMLNQEKYSSGRKRFIVLDIISSPLPRADLVICRDCLVHFSNSDIFSALKNIKASGSNFLLTTTFLNRTSNRKIVTGEWHPINLVIPPFNLPVPLEIVDDSYDSPNYYDKHLGLWRIQEIPDY